MFKPQMIAESVKIVQDQIKRACIAAARSPETVTLVAVSKTFEVGHVSEAIRAGVLDLGENYVQEISEKRVRVSDQRVRWHFLGHLQSNKVKYIADWIHMIHSVDSENIAAEIQKRGAKAGRTIDVLIEVNTSGESSKFGVKPGEALELVKSVSRFPNVHVQGLMTIGPFLPDPDQSRPSFRILKTLFDEINHSGILVNPMAHLSMGMSHDFAVAIEEGSTMVRIGTAIFGEREKSTGH